MRREWETEDLIESWTLAEGDRRLVGNKTGPTRLGFALMLKFFEVEARFPRHGGEVPGATVEYVAAQVKVAPGEFVSYDWRGRSVKYHRAQIREAFGFREATGAYRSEMDVIGAFLRDECELGGDFKATLKDVYERYEAWCEEGGERAKTKRKFNARPTERGSS